MIVTLSGENRFLVQLQLNEMVTKFVDKYGDMGLERVDAEEADFERIKESLVGSTLFAEHKLVVIKHVEANKQLLENLEQIIGAIPETTDVIFVIPKIDKRAKYSKILQKLTDFQTLNQLDSRALATWVVNEAKNQNTAISLGDAQYLVDRVGTNQAIVGQELSKLTLHGSHITKEVINKLTEPLPQSTVFELLDAAFAGNRSRMMTIYEQQRQLKNEPLAILGMIAWQLHILAIVITAKDKTPSEIAKEAKIHPFVVGKTQKIARQVSYSRLKELVESALILDIRLKSQSINADDALKHYLLSLAT